MRPPARFATSANALVRTLGLPLSRFSLSGWRAYLFAAALIGVAALARWALPAGLGARVPFPTLELAVFAAAWVGGWRAGLFASALTVLWGLLFLPAGQTRWDWRNGVALAFVFAVCALGAYACARLRRATDVVEQDRAWYERILDLAADAVLVVDDGGHLRYFNSQAAALWALTPSSLGLDVSQAVSLWEQEAGPRCIGLRARILECRGKSTLPLGLEVRAGSRTVAVMGTISRFRDPHYGDAAVVSVHSIQALEDASRLVLETKNLLQVVIDQVPALVGFVRPDGTTALANQRYRELTRQPLLGGDWRTGLDPECVEPILARLPEVQGGSTCRLTLRSEAGDRGARDLQLHLVPCRQPDGRSAGTVVYAHDITDHLMRERSLANSEARFRQLAEASAAVVWQATVDGRLTAQIGWTQYTGAEELAHVEQWLDWVHPDDRGTARQFLGALGGSERDLLADLRLRVANGAYRHVTLRALVLEQTCSSGVEWIGTVQDVHERRMAEQALASKQTELSLILNAVPARIAYLSASGEFQWANRNFTRWFEYPGDIKGQSLEAVIPADQLAALQEPIRGAMHGLITQLEWRQDHPALGPRWTTTTLSPDLDPFGRLRGVISLCVDNTQRHESEEALRRSDAEHRTLAENVPHMVWMADANGYLQYCNSRWHEFIGPDAYGHFTDRIHPEDRPAALGQFHTAVQSSAEFSIEVRYPRASDGACRWHLVRALPLLDPDGRILRWYGSCTDIDDQKAAEQTLRDANRRTNHFLATLSHELRNPMAALMASAEVLDSALAGEALRVDATESIRRQSWHLKKLTDDLLDISRINLGHFRMSSAPIDLGAVCRNVCHDFSGKARHYAVGIHCAVPDRRIVVQGDATRIRQCVDNLVSNAIKASSPGMSVRIAASVDEGLAQITVSDEGVGLDEQALAAIFLPFWQGEGWHDRGLGLGLGIVKNLVELHGGSVWASSPGTGMGATFGIRLPLADAAETGPVEWTAPARRPASRAGKVLIVDDEVDNATALQCLLQLEGHDVHVAHEGTAALTMAQAIHPEVVICDLGLPPPLHGLDVAGRLRAMFGPGIHLCAYSGYGAQSDLERSMAAGFDGHLIKPAAPSAISAEVDRGLQRIRSPGSANPCAAS